MRRRRAGAGRVSRSSKGPSRSDNLVGILATECRRWHSGTMAHVEKLSVALTQDMATEVRAAVASGDYGTVSEVIRDALRAWRLRRKIETLETDELRRLVTEGIESGPGLDADAVFAKLRARFGRPEVWASRAGCFFHPEPPPIWRKSPN